MCFCVLRLQKSCLAEKSHLGTVSLLKKRDNPRGPGVQKLSFTPFENLSNQREESAMMAHRRTEFDPHSTKATLLVGSKLPRSSGGNIKEKISLWEGKEPSGSLGTCASVKKTESLVQNYCKSAVEEHDAERCWRKEHVARENGDSRPCSPSKSRQQRGGTIKSSKPKEKLKAEEDCSGGVCGQDYEKENVESLVATRPNSPAKTGGLRRSMKLNGTQTAEDCKGAQKETQEHCKDHLEKMGDSRPRSPVQEQEQVGTLRRSSDRKNAAQASQEKKAMFTLFKKLEAMGENPGRTPRELGNYFSPPSKDKYTEVRKKESRATNSGAAERPQNRENVYAELGAPPINPVPKPQRTFQHPSFEQSQRKGRGQRNLPPLPNTSAKPPSGVFLRPRGGRAGDATNRC